MESEDDLIAVSNILINDLLYQRQSQNSAVRNAKDNRKNSDIQTSIVNYKISGGNESLNSITEKVPLIYQEKEVISGDSTIDNNNSLVDNQEQQRNAENDTNNVIRPVDNQEQQRNAANNDTNNVIQQKDGSNQLHNENLAHHVIIDKRYAELLRDLGNNFSKVKKRVSTLTEENIRIKRQCTLLKKEYLELQTKYTQTVQQIEVKQNNELKRIKTQKIKELQVLELLSNDIKDLLKENATADFIQGEDLNDYLFTQKNTQTNEISSTTDDDNNQVECTICNRFFDDLPALERHKKHSRPHHENVRAQKK